MRDEWKISHKGLVQSLIAEILKNSTLGYSENNTKIESMAKINGRDFRYLRIVFSNTSFGYEINRDDLWKITFKYDQTDPEIFKKGAEEKWFWTGTGNHIEFEKDMTLVKLFLNA